MCPIASSAADDQYSVHAEHASTPTIDEIRQLLDQSLSPLCLRALEHAHQELATPVLNHSLRVFLYAENLAVRPTPENLMVASPTLDREVERELLFVAALFHDIGTSSTYDGPQRFEVEGADAAAAFLRTHAVAEADVYQVWLAIAIHSTGSIAERLGRLPYLIRTAVKADFADWKREELGVTEFGNEIEKKLPRLQVEIALANAVVRQMLSREGGERENKAPENSWPNGLLEGHSKDPDWTTPNPRF